MRNRYRSNPSVKIAAVLARYKKHRRQHKLAMRMHYKQSQLHRMLSAQKAYYTPSGSKKAAIVSSHAKKTVKASACSYSLHQPKQHTRELYVKVMKQAVLQMPSVRIELTRTFKASKKCASGQLTRSELTNAVLNIAVRMVVSKALRERKAAVGEFLVAVRKVNNLHWSNDNFGDCCHTASSEPYFYDQSYAVCATRNTPIPVKENGTCLVAAEIKKSSDEESNERPSKWKCTPECKLPTRDEKRQIVDIKSAFEKMSTLRRYLDNVDSGCQNGHYICRATGRKLAGHPLTCTVGGCSSKLRTLRAAAPHYPRLRTFLTKLYEAMRKHRFIASIDCYLRAGNFSLLVSMLDLKPYNKLFQTDSMDNTGASHKVRVGSRPELVIQRPNLPNLESELYVDHAVLIAKLDKKVVDDPEFTCCSCERLHCRKNVTAFEFDESKKFISTMWYALRAYMFM